MSWDFINIRTVKSRKAHHCENCGKPIACDEAHIYVAGKTEGEFMTYREHADCRAAWVELNFDLRDCEEAGFLRDDEFAPEDKTWMRTEFPAVAERLWGAA